VSSFEPREALYAGKDGLDVVRTIAADAASVVRPGGSLWLEADTSNIEAARELLAARGAKRTEILTDPYDRPRVVVAYY
jgi:release factor glutamine methyltransferase